MKEATGEVSMTMVTIVAIAVIGGILALMWNPIKNWIESNFKSAAENTNKTAPTGDMNFGLQ